jgi:uncharacterized protein YdhG (YjbR/CyaY superfamily)
LHAAPVAALGGLRFKLWVPSNSLAGQRSPIHDQNMAMKRKTPKDIDDYLSRYPKHVQRLLTQMRLTIKNAAPQATEKISYGIPTFSLAGNLVHFAAFKNHIGFYPTPSAISAFSNELFSYKCSKGTVQFPLDEPLPLTLVSQMVKFRVKQKKMKVQKD